MREPLPLPGEDRLRLRRGDFTSVEAHTSTRCWKASRSGRPTGLPDRIPGEDDDLAHVRVFGQARAAASCLLTPPRPDERWNDEPHRLGAVRLAPVAAAARRRGERGGAVHRADEHADRRARGLRHLRPAADRHHPARGQRRHRQDLDDRRAGDPLRRRGRATLEQMLVVTFGRAASQELRERVRAQLVEAERALADAGRRPRARATCVDLLLDTDAGGARRAPAAAARRARPTSTPPPSPPPTSSASWCCAASASPATPTPDATLVEDLDDLLGRGGRRPLRPRRSPAATRTRRSPPATALTLARKAVGDPQARLEPRDADPETPPGRRLAFAARGARRDGRAQAAAGRAQLRRPAHPARRRAATRRRTRPGSGCGSAGAWCSSTSSRTPTRCSGRCSTGRSPATPRWC